jgi:hypothetical protein
MTLMSESLIYLVIQPNKLKTEKMTFSYGKIGPCMHFLQLQMHMSKCDTNGLTTALIHDKGIL